MAAYHDELERHVTGFFAGHPATVRHAATRKTELLAPDFHVLELAPGPRTPNWTYVSIGAGVVEPPNGSRLEFVLCSRTQGARQVELLEMTAHYHLSGETLDVGHTFSIGEPWIAGSGLASALISLPYPFGLELELFDREPHRARVLWLLPISNKERAFARRHGLEVLESLFDDRAIDYADPFRRSVV